MKWFFRVLTSPVAFFLFLGLMVSLVSSYLFCKVMVVLLESPVWKTKKRTPPTGLDIMKQTRIENRFSKEVSEMLCDSRQTLKDLGRMRDKMSGNSTK